MRLRILAVGKLKDEGLERWVAELCRRSRGSLPIELVHQKSLAALRLKAEHPRVVLDERGRQLGTESMARWLGDQRERSVRRIDFLIGESHGFEEKDRAQADEVWALSKLTLPHRLAQLLLVEQLYRCGTILAGHPYHH